MNKLHSGNLYQRFGVQLLDDYSRAEDVPTIQKLEELITLAEDIGCVEALREKGHNTEYLLSKKRAAYIDLLGIKPTDHVLEIGSSMGQHTRLAARKCKRVSALEIVPLQALFSKIWCDEEGLDNVDVTSGDMSGRLPYEDSTFDVVICNYVLEWCAGRHQGSTKEFHREFLREIFRSLKSGGKLYLSTKNRFSIRYLLGSEDEHLGIRFGSALPRALQNMARRRADLGHPTGYLHSWNALEQLLRDVGFSQLERLLGFPDARYPDYLGPFSGFSRELLSEDIIQKVGKKNKLSMYLPSPIFQQTTNSLIFFAQKGL